MRGFATSSSIYESWQDYEDRHPQFATVYLAREPEEAKIDPFTGEAVPPVINQTVVNQPVVERIIEREVMKPVEHIVERMIEPIRESWYKKYSKELLIGIMSSIIVYLIGFR